MGRRGRGPVEQEKKQAGGAFEGKDGGGKKAMLDVKEQKVEERVGQSAWDKTWS